MRHLLFFSLYCISFLCSSSENLAICFYDIDANKRMNKARMQVILDHLRQAKADIIILAGVKNESEIKNIKSKLKKFTYSQLVKGEDKNSHLAFLSKEHPESFQAITNLKYKIKNSIELLVQRGFFHATINKNGYILHIFGADLKNRDKHPRYNQTDMRRYEARLLRKLVNALFKKDKTTNVLIMGNLNDTCGKSPIKDIYNRRFGIEKTPF